jgi:hypothetical protein
MAKASEARQGRRRSGGGDSGGSPEAPDQGFLLRAVPASAEELGALQPLFTPLAQQGTEGAGRGAASEELPAHGQGRGEQALFRAELVGGRGALPCGGLFARCPGAGREQLVAGNLPPGLSEERLGGPGDGSSDAEGAADGDDEESASEVLLKVMVKVVVQPPRVRHSLLGYLRWLGDFLWGPAAAQAAAEPAPPPGGL